ncbi:MAG: methyltransferase domain-containing protein [Melioribacteraceae bacterium]|nr:methyltransferase domain-containing protein [Melioribacteraceae bacterium]
MRKNIKRMKLYHHPERIYNELGIAGLKKDVTLKIEDISQYDQYHYLGTESVDEAIRGLTIDATTKVFDVGSGVGGPARYIAEKTGAYVTALELQPDLNATAQSLTQQCGLTDLVTHLCGNILEFTEEDYKYDALVSWLVFLHIPDRSSLLKKCNNILKANGKMFIEDFYKRGEFDKEELRILSEDVYCNYLPTLEEYRVQLTANGFSKIELVDMTERWSVFVKERFNKFIENRERHIKVNGIEIVEGLEDFYQKIVGLFNGRKLGGVRIVAQKE